MNNLTTNVSNKPLSAAQGVVLKGLIDTLSNNLENYQPKGDYALRSELPTVPTNVSAFTNDAGYLTKHQDISHKLDANKLPEAINTALVQAKASGEFDGEDGESGATFTPAVAADGTLSWTNDKGMDNPDPVNIKGPAGQRGTGLLPVTTAPSSYTTAVGGITPKYRMAISTIKSQAGVTEVLLGDTIRQSYYHYPIAYLDASYAYCTERVSIRGATGTSVTVSSVTESTEDGGENVVTFSDGKTMAVRNGSSGTGGGIGNDEKTLLLALFEKTAYTDDVGELVSQLKTLWGLGYTNLVPLSVDESGNVYNNGLGYKNGYRIRSGGVEAEQTNATITGFIPCKAGDIIRFALANGNTTPWWNDSGAQSCSLNAYDSAKTNLGQFATQPAGYGIFSGANEHTKMVKNGDVWEYTVTANADIAFFRITVSSTSGTIMGDDVVITVNQEIA